MIDKNIELQDGGGWNYWTSGMSNVPAWYVEKHYKLALARIAELEAIIDNDTQQLDAHYEAEHTEK